MALFSQCFYMFVLFIMFTLVEMLVFHSSITAHLESTQLATEPVRAYSEVIPFTKRDNLQKDMSQDQKQELQIEPKPEPIQQEPTQEQDNVDTVPAPVISSTSTQPTQPPSHSPSISTQPNKAIRKRRAHRSPPTPPPLPTPQGLISSTIPAQVEESPSPPLPPSDDPDYYTALNKAIIKASDNKNTWNLDSAKYECFLNSNFTCDPIYNIADVSSLPENFRHACAPSFIIPGTAKSGTTSLYFYLVEHPQVHQALSGMFNKEVRFFNEHWLEGSQWYVKQFPPITRNDFPDHNIHMIHGEASPTYFYDMLVPYYIKSTIPKAKLIVVLRDPVDRAYSDKMQLIANGVLFFADEYSDMNYQITSFNECFDQARKHYNTEMEAFYSCYSYPKLTHNVIHSHPYVMDSIYLFQVQNWLRYFPREQIMFIKGEDMYTDASKVMDRVTDFLGLCKIDWSPFIAKVHNRRDMPYRPMSDDVRELLTTFYRNYTLALYKELNYDFSWDSALLSPT